ncbi:MAG: hypothetical protein JST66_16645 [Bacteroidetes bacterium]|nr:hypothetical protein [Bacteroidota bacterium]
MAAVLLLSSCLKTEEFPVEPKIGFKSYGTFADSASLTISFTDGDGDIGLDQGDTLSPYEPGSTYYHNFFVDYYRRVNGVWMLQEFPLPLYYRVPRITPTGQNKALEGDIAVAIYAAVLPQVPGDTVRFKVRLADRALHMSNEVYSNDIIVP